MISAEGGDTHDPRCDCYMCSRPKARTKQPPLLRRSGLTKTVWVVTRYKERPNGLIEALEKFDVTDQFDALLADR